MAIPGIKISTLTGYTNPDPNDYLVINDANEVTTKKITYANLFDKITTSSITVGDVTINKLVNAAANISSNDNDTSIPTSAAVKAYVDGVTSDYRLKSNVSDFEGSLNLLSNIKIYEYDISDNGKTSREIGVIAHEIQEEIPYLVNGEKDGEQFQTVNYSKMVPILLSAIQELKAEIEELKK